MGPMIRVFRREAEQICFEATVHKLNVERYDKLILNFVPDALNNSCQKQLKKMGPCMTQSSMEFNASGQSLAKIVATPLAA